MPRWIRWLLALIPLAGVSAGVLRAANGLETKAHADSTFVRRDSFAMSHQRDSLMGLNDIRDLKRMLSGLDSSDRCRRGQSGFCR